MTAIRRRLCIVAMALGLAACAGLGGPRTVTFEPQEIEHLLARGFPIERRVLEVFDVSLDAPTVHLLAERRRLGLTMVLHARDRLRGGTWQGHIEFDAALRWQPADQTVRLAQVRVQELALDGAASRPVAERLAAVLVERELEGLSIYRLSPERAAVLQAQGLAPSAVTVTARGVEITLLPVAR